MRYQKHRRSTPGTVPLVVMAVVLLLAWKTGQRLGVPWPGDPRWNSTSSPPQVLDGPGPASWPSHQTVPSGTASHSLPRLPQQPLLTGGTKEAAQLFKARVVGVSDGDTITVLRAEEMIRIRVEGIDCPEKGQPFGQEAKSFTSRQVFGREVTVYPTGQDRYGRLLAHVVCDGQSLAHELLRAGLAWHFKQYNRDADLAVIEQEARVAQRGLWGEQNSTPPWDWRRRS